MTHSSASGSGGSSPLGNDTNDGLDLDSNDKGKTGSTTITGGPEGSLGEVIHNALTHVSPWWQARDTASGSCKPLHHGTQEPCMEQLLCSAVIRIRMPLELMTVAVAVLLVVQSCTASSSSDRSDGVIRQG